MIDLLGKEEGTRADDPGGDMIWLLMFLLVLWVVLAILGFVVKGLMWLAWVAIILVVITLIIGFVAGIFSGGGE